MFIYLVEIGHFEVEITTSESEEVLRMDDQNCNVSINDSTNKSGKFTILLTEKSYIMIM